MFTALKAAIKYGLVVNLPSYDEMRPRVLQSNQRVISKENRHGQIFKVISNNDMHTMSIRTKDYSVLEFGPNEKQKVGAWRHFSVVDPFAEWHQGWRSLEITPTEQLKTFFEEHKLAIPTGFVGPDGVRQQVVHFEYFVHPNLAFAFYGSPYILLKIMAQRMKDQADHYRQQARELREEGVRLPPPKEPQEVITYTQTEPGKKVVVPSIEAKVILPKVEGEDYPIYSLGDDWKPKKHEKMPDTRQKLQGVLRYAERVERELTYGIGAALRAEVRAIELAYRLHGFIKGHELEPGWEIHPGWDIPEWDREYVEPGKRIVWNALQLSDDAFLLYRARM